MASASAAATAAGACRRALVDAFGESSDSEDEAYPCSVPRLVRETVDSDSDAVTEAQSPNEDQRRALIEAFGESSDSEDRILAELTKDVYESSSDKEDQASHSSAIQICGDGRRAPVEACGDSSDGEDEAPASIAEKPRLRSRSYSWQSVEGIEGLRLCRNFLSEKHQLSLIRAIQREGWFAEGSDSNQGMRFGDLPEWATELSRTIREAVCFAEACSGVIGEELTFEDSYFEEDCPLPVDILWREPLFDQLIINVYKPGEGICAHVDLMRFADGIAIVSLESACVMHFTRCEQEADTTEVCSGEYSPQTRIPVYLSPGSLVLLSGEARYRWKHEINRKPGFQLWEGKEIHQERRTSVTLRKLLQLPNES